MHLHRSLVVAPIAASLCLTTVSQGVTVNLGALRDNTIYDDGAGELSNGRGTGLFAGRNGISQTTRALLAFDIASVVPAGSTITSVSLRLVRGAGPSSTNTVSLFTMTSDWGEGTTVASGGGGGGGPATPNSATWLHNFYNSQFWTTPGGDFDPVSVASTDITGNGAYTWSSPAMVADVQSWLNAGSTNFGWMLRGVEAGMGTANRFASRESTVSADRPILTIEYIPTPGAAGLMAVGLCAFARRRR